MATAPQHVPMGTGLPTHGVCTGNPTSNRSGPRTRPRNPLPYGYHNSFHTHTLDSRPPSYEQSQKTKPMIFSPAPDFTPDTPAPSYKPTVYYAGVVGLLMEFKDPFLGKPKSEQWQKVFAVLRGTSLTVHWIKFRLNSKKSEAQPGKKIAQFSLQHAEVGLAVDVRPSENQPKNPVLQLLPPKMKDKLIKTKPQLFETQNEWLLRLRVEGFQFLMSFETEFLLLEWCEEFCKGIDISPPIDDRTDPRYRSLPRRSRRQRQLESYVDGVFQDGSENANGLESLNNRLVEQQERILRTFYPNLAAANGDRTSRIAVQRPVSTAFEPAVSADQDMDEFDAADVMEVQANDRVSNRQPLDPNTPSKSSTLTIDVSEPEIVSTAELRFRRRCMPIMYKYSLRGSDIIFYKGARWRVDHKRGVLRSFEMGPPRYMRNSRKAIAFREAATAINRALRPQQVSITKQADGVASYRTSSGYSGRPEDSDTLSVTSVANTTGSAHDGHDPVSRVVSMFNARDEISENTISPDVALMLKEKAAMQERRPSHAEQVSNAFAGLVL